MKILLPALSPTMETGNLVKWLVKEGQAISSGDILAEIETDKATMELESPEDGLLSKILINEGSENIPVNTPLAVLSIDGEDEEVEEGDSSQTLNTKISQENNTDKLMNNNIQFRIIQALQKMQKNILKKT